MIKTTTKMKLKIRPYCSFLTMFLLIGTLYLSISATYNVIKFVDYRVKLSQLQDLHDDALTSKKNLIAEIESYKSSKAYEAFMRNNLKWAKKDEIPVVLVESNDKSQNKTRTLYYAY